LDVLVLFAMVVTIKKRDKQLSLNRAFSNVLFVKKNATVINVLEKDTKIKEIMMYLLKDHF